MNNIIRYNTYILNCIIVSVLIVLILILAYKIWKKHINFKIKFRWGLFKDDETSREEFSQISLEKRVGLYDDYRNFLEGKDILKGYCSRDKRMLPYKVSPKCFNEHYLKCMNEKKLGKPTYNDYSVYDGYQDEDYFNLEHDVSYEDGFKISSVQCQEKSLNMCLNDNLNFV